MHITRSATLGLMFVFTFPVYDNAYSCSAVVCLGMEKKVVALQGSDTFRTSSHFSDPDYIPFQPGFSKFFFEFLRV